MGPKIGSGSFGSVHAGVDLNDNYRYVAIKLEPLKPNHHPQLEREYKIYKQVHHYYQSKRNRMITKSREEEDENVPKGVRDHTINHNPTQTDNNHNKQWIPPIDPIGIPKIYYFGKVDNHPYNALIMDMLGPSLEKLFNICGRKFSLKTVSMLADQMLSRLEFIHDTGYLHRDLKPDNFLMGMYASERVVYTVDLGLGKSYMMTTDDGQRKHIPYQDGKTLTGTARYASVNTHLGVEQSRRDDLESLGYIFMYFLRGRLPWQGIKVSMYYLCM